MLGPRAGLTPQRRAEPKDVAMRLTLIHADTFSFAVGSAARTPDSTPDAMDADRHEHVQNALVAFTAVEGVDEAALEEVVRRAADLLTRTALRVGAGTVVVAPTAHLSEHPSRPELAADVLTAVEVAMASRGDGPRVVRAPSGHDRSFEPAGTGHPLSEPSPTLPRSDDGTTDPDGPAAAPESAALRAEREIVSEWRVYGADGSFVPAERHGLREDDRLAQLYAYERHGTREAEDAPPHIRLMREHELVDYEPASDTGNMRWYPNGVLVKRLLEQRVTELVTAYGGMEVETPLMYDYAHPALAKYLQRFPARQYVLRSEDRELFLRFAACFGQYMIMRDLVASHHDLPLRLYELTHHSFRRERGGEVSGLRRLRAFTMPDMHTMAADTEMAKAEFLAQVGLCLQWVDDLELPCVPAIRFVRSFLDANPDFLPDLMRVLDRPALVEIWDDRFFYFVVKFELNFVDNAARAACLSTVQIDVENSERFDIGYVAADASRQTPLLLHTSVSGSVDRNVYALLEQQAYEVAHGRKAVWPMWLAPSQVRLLPVSPGHVAGAVALADRLGFRVEVDDRDLRVGKKVRDAERDWVPYVVVVGDRELVDDGALSARCRSGTPFTGTVEDLDRRLEAETAGRPRRPLNGPRLLSRRPVFVG